MHRLIPALPDFSEYPMPIDFKTEKIITLTEATKVLPLLNGKRPSICTLWRWCRKGLRGVQLEYVRLGRNIATSQEALNRFANNLAAADAAPPQAQEPVREQPRPPSILPLRKVRPNQRMSARPQRLINGLTATEILDRAGI